MANLCNMRLLYSIPKGGRRNADHVSSLREAQKAHSGRKLSFALTSPCASYTGIQGGHARTSPSVKLAPGSIRHSRTWRV